MVKSIQRLATYWLVLIFTSTNSQSIQKPNVLFIISDDLTTSAVSAYENESCHTPHIDQLAREGVLFTKAYCQFPVCGPSRASLLFGYYPHATETFGYVSGREKVGSARKSWPELFRDNGYHTARVGKIFHMGSQDFIDGTDGADDHASWIERYNSAGPEWQTPGKAELVQNNPDGTIKRKRGNLLQIVQAECDDSLMVDFQTADKAVQLMRKLKDKPFFLAIGFFRPHVPFVAPKRYFECFPHQHMILPPQVVNDWDDIPPQGINYVNSLNSQMSQEQEKKAIAAYYASVAFLDDQVGRVLRALREEGLDDNTIVIFTSDHGFHLGEHRFWMKVSLKEESARVPLIIKVPGKKPAVCHSFVELIDLYPTVAHLAGLQTSHHLQGKNMTELFSNPNKTIRQYTFSVSSWNNKFSFLIRTPKWAFIQYGENAEGGSELFDMEYDPQQFNNLVGNPRFGKIVESFRSELKRKLAEIRTNDLGIRYQVH
ncbi:MAG TPA: sulfatase [Membranihabitans sp.]|nr:sulfatase [Membranihabitans sp.]